jgi:predicted dienelactone hydrolase
VELLRFEWLDKRRDRKIPVKVYHPSSGAGPFPVLLFSHGLGGSREDYGFLGRHWAGQGYVSLHIQHLGSDSAIWQNAPPGEVSEALRRAAMQPDNTTNRIQDVVFSLDQLPSLNHETGTLQNRLDLLHIGLAGHSFGALTTLAIAGQVFTSPSGYRITSPDSRIKASLAMSAPLPRDKAHWDTAYAEMRVPCLHMTGTEDSILIGNSPPEDRRVPFDRTAGADAYLITFKGADHMVFVGLKRNAAREELDLKIQDLIKKTSLIYWDAVLREDPDAKTHFTKTGLSHLLGSHGRFEVKQT